MKEMVHEKKIPKCPECDGLVKPDIVFFGEALPEHFWKRRHDMHHAGTAPLHLSNWDLVFVIGTSLVVHPFASLPGYTLPSKPRILLNNDRVEDFDRPNDAYISGDCDESVWKLCRKLGWHEDLRKLHKKIGGINREWDTDFQEPGEKTVVEDTVAQLTKDLERELKLDKAEDAELQKVEDKVDKRNLESNTQPDQKDAIDKDANIEKYGEESSGKETKEKL